MSLYISTEAYAGLFIVAVIIVAIWQPKPPEQ